MVLPLIFPALTQEIPDVAQRQFVSNLDVSQLCTGAFPLANPIFGLA
jgi:hypothetical protein